MSVLVEAVPHMLCMVLMEGGPASHTGRHIARQRQQSVPWEMKRIEVKELLISFVYVVPDAGCEVVCVAIHNGQEFVADIVVIVCHSDSVRRS
jgi:hypothetical protein